MNGLRVELSGSNVVESVMRQMYIRQARSVTPYRVGMSPKTRVK